MFRWASIFALVGASLPFAASAQEVVRPLPYELIYVRAPYFGPGPGVANSVWPDVVRPLIPDPGAQLVLMKTSGVREVLFPLERYRGQIDTPAGKPLSVGSVADPNVSFDGRSVLFTWYHDATDRNDQRGGLSRRGADLYKLDLATRALVRLTRQQLTPNTGNGARFGPNDPGSNHPRIGVFNTGGTWISGGAAGNRIVFTSSRDDYLPPKAMSSVQRALQLFAMDADGTNVEPIGPLNVAMALHPMALLDGRIAFTSWEEQGLRDTRQFALWVIAPDGRSWNSLSGYSENALAHHFMTQMPNGDLVVCRYYNLNDNGFGDLVRYPIDPPGPDFATSDPEPSSGAIPFERIGQRLLAPWTTPDDYPAPCPGREDNPYASAGPENCAGADRRGKLTHPAAAPSIEGDPAKADLLAVYSPGPVNHNGAYVSSGSAFPWPHGRIVLFPDGEPVATPPAGVPGQPPGLITILYEPGYNLAWPRPVVTWRQLYGIDAPPQKPELSDAAIHAERMTPGEPFGLIGSSSLLWRESEGALGPFQPERDPFDEPTQNPLRWTRQGSDAGIYSDDDVVAIRVVMQQAQTDRSYPANGPKYSVIGGERMRILGEIPVKKPNAPPVRHPDGTLHADTSFLAKVPADVALTFQTIDRRGMVLNMAQTWHQLRPGEARYNCGGCHAHSLQPLDFETTAAAKPDFPIPDLARTTPLLTLDAGGAAVIRLIPGHATTVEYRRDVLPIFERRCASCHGAASPAAGLPLTAAAGTIERDGTWPRTYWQLIQDMTGELSEPPPSQYGLWFVPQLTRYVRAFQSRQSLLLWKVWGERLDGRTNADRTDDLDFAASAAHPAGVGVPGMTVDERMTLARWIDLGAPIDFGQPWGFLEDDQRPTLVVRPSVVRARAARSVRILEIAAFDVESGVVPGSLTVTCNLRLGSVPAGGNLAAGKAINPEGGVLRLTLPRKVTTAERPVLTVTVRDSAGHRTQVVRSYKP
ncbi:MAG TPA: hypothetical protein VGS22_07820 [Thermoanaerobaculia bacterium]|jgi:hypothetical protein|nr:hypothetical protein [Thermoanaerobaculia bacterium]